MRLVLPEGGKGKGSGGRSAVPHLLQHLVLLVEKLHLDVAAHGQRLRELEQHHFVLALRVGRVGGVDLHLQLVHDKLRV